MSDPTLSETTRFDISRGDLPPGQVETRKFPVVGERAPPPEALDLEAYRLEVTGQVARPLSLTYEDVLSLPQATLRADIHCVTGWTHFGMTLTGTPLRELLQRAEPTGDARFVRFVAHSDRTHDTSLPLELARVDTWLIHSRDGAPLEPKHGFPLRTVTPSRYFYKSLKWLNRIELLAEDVQGFWERESSYHDVGDPWAGDQRFRTGSVAPETVARFRNAASYVRYRGIKKILIGVDLQGWQPSTTDLGALFLKRCDLREAQLRDADLRGANFSLSNLDGANLRNADLTGADLEGASFLGADLRGARLDDCALSATRFVDPDDDTSGAKVDGMSYQGAYGLLESQEAFMIAGSTNLG